MSDPRDPRQVQHLDRVTLRRQMKHALPADLILDGEEWDELLDLSNQSARLNIIRKNLIAARRNGGQVPRTLDEQERFQLARYVQGDGPRPRWAKYVDMEGHYGFSHRRDDDPVPAPPPEPWPATLDGDPGRSVRPKGEYGIPGVTV